MVDYLLLAVLTRLWKGGPVLPTTNFLYISRDVPHRLTIEIPSCLLWKIMMLLLFVVRRQSSTVLLPATLLMAALLSVSLFSETLLLMRF